MTENPACDGPSAASDCSDSAAPKQQDVRKMFLHHQEKMAADLKRFSLDISHPTAKGDGTERCWRRMLRDYLPKRYSVDSGFVMDHTGQCSRQIDLIIFDRHYTPFLFCEEGINYVPAESVYMVFEVKQDLSREHIIYAGKIAESVRTLERTSRSILHIDGPSKRKPPPRIPAGILTFDSSWSPSLGQSFYDVIQELSVNQRLDLGCAVDGGSFECKYDESDESPRVSISEHEDSLISFFLRLMSQLQALGTAPPMDLDEWEQPLSLNWKQLIRN